MANEAEITALKAKIKARENQPGMAENMEALKVRLAALESNARFRDKLTLKFVPDAHAYANPDSTEPVRDTGERQKGNPK